MPHVIILTDYAAKSLNNIYIRLYGFKMNDKGNLEQMPVIFYQPDMITHYKMTNPTTGRLNLNRFNIMHASVKS
ncbi:hypothetical protein GCM10008943_05720 [Paenochrobactrum glaciei]|uniref:Uncharacterized protein n=1 Tax=Paenochrobactrum glaciei TaxID=486407 RepID=A0ABP3QNE2_9HYPH